MEDALQDTLPKKRWDDIVQTIRSSDRTYTKFDAYVQTLTVLYLQPYDIEMDLPAVLLRMTNTSSHLLTSIGSLARSMAWLACH